MQYACPFAYAVSAQGPAARAAATLAAMEAFCHAWAGSYDVVFYCCDRFSQHQTGDPYRAKVLDLQPAADRVVRSTCATVGQRSNRANPGGACSAGCC